MQRFDHLEGQRPAPVGLLVEKAQGLDLVTVLGDVVHKRGHRHVGLRFGLGAVAGKADLVGRQVVDQLLTLAARAFDLVAQAGCIKRRAGGRHSQGPGGGQLRRRQGFFTAGDLRGLGRGQRGGDDGVGVQRGQQRPAQLGHRHATSGLGHPGLRFFV